MGDTFTKIYLHFVFAVQDRASLIKDEWKKDLYKYITGIIHTNKHQVIVINGMPDHIHILVSYRQHQTIPSLLQDIKASSSKWINEQNFTIGRFAWQAGYAAFSYSESQIDIIANYIRNQEKHHAKKSFQEEYITFLKKYNIPYVEKYILHNVE